jgi:hypothetical protein
MNNFFKNILLLLIALVLSYFAAHYFGFLYNKFSPGQLDGSWIGSRGSWQFIIGFPFAFIFFLVLIFCSFVPRNHKKWVGWLLAPAFIFYAAGDLIHIYLPVILALIALGIAIILRKIFHRGQAPQIQ